MGDERPAVALYDFLYRDSGRITSYYAQLFGGHLTAREETAADRESGEKVGKISVSVFGGEKKSVQEASSGSKRTFSPHDVNTTDVLATLIDERRVHDKLEEAPHGALVVAQGTLIFLDRTMLELAGTVMESVARGLADAEKKKPKHQRDPQVLHGIDMVKSLLNKLPLPSAFLMKTVGDAVVVGTVKDEGMEEPISSYHFKHGTAGLAGVHLLGIKEMPSDVSAEIGKDLINISRQAAQGLSDMLFPKEAVRVTPIAMFRKLPDAVPFGRVPPGESLEQR